MSLTATQTATSRHSATAMAATANQSHFGLLRGLMFGIALSLPVWIFAAWLAFKFR